MIIAESSKTHCNPPLLCFSQTNQNRESRKDDWPTTQKQAEKLEDNACRTGSRGTILARGEDKLRFLIRNLFFYLFKIKRVVILNEQ